MSDENETDQSGGLLTPHQPGAAGTLQQSEWTANVQHVPQLQPLAERQAQVDREREQNGAHAPISTEQ